MGKPDMSDMVEIQLLRAWVELTDALDRLGEDKNQVIWITNWPEGQTIYATGNYESIWGKTVGGLLNSVTDWIDSIHPEDIEAASAAWKNGAHKGEFDVVFRINCPDGSICKIRDRGYPVHDADGNVYRIVGMAEDISD